MTPSPPPKELEEKILAQKSRIEGWRKQVTVMFCDLEQLEQVQTGRQI